ncbi:Crp/Fnr family transcriptional regulator [Pseudopedobacter sp.]|uniref:Crp/Fnr family transcriptional regulator n=1 Tax=Pseudopedobacter sp. TaxID=1936787 RepID=UPI003341CFFB
MIPIELLIEKGAIIKKVEAGEVLFQENSLSSHYYQLLTGRVRISNFLADGKEVLHKIIGVNEGCGHVCVFGDGVHVVSAIADVPSTLLKISAPHFIEIMKENSDLLILFTQKIAKDLRFKLFLTKLICNHCPEEIITKLIQIFNEDGKLVCQECNRLMLTRQQLANMTGMRVETIIRTMKQMARENKLNIIKGKVFIPADGID